MARVKLPFNQEDLFEVSTLRELAEKLENKYAIEGKFRKFLNIYVNGEDYRFLQGYETQIKEDDEIIIMPALAGG